MIFRHLLNYKRARPAVWWMNAFAFLGLFIGVFAWISVTSIMGGLQKNIKERILKERAHLLWEGNPRNDLSGNIQSFQKSTFYSEHVLRFETILQTEGLLEIPKSTQQGRISGSGVVIQGVQGLQKSPLIGAELADVLGLGIGDSFLIRSPWKLELQPMELNLQGFFQTGLYEVDSQVLRVEQQQLETWLGLDHSFSRIEIQLKDPFLALGSMKEKISEMVGLPFQNWEQAQSTLWYSLKLEKIAMGVAVFFVILLSIVAVHLALSVRIAEKSREIALLRALGAQSRDLEMLYLVEGGVLGLLGSGFGLLASFLFCKFISQTNLVLLPGFFYNRQIPVDWNWSMNLAMMALSVVLAILVSWWPARKVTQLEISQALRS